MTRIPPLDPPYAPELADQLARWMPPGADVAPLALFRVLARHAELFSRMRPLGAGLLGHGRLRMRDRELLVLRTTARAGAGYEWGVHASAFAEAAGLTPAQVEATATGPADDPVWGGDPAATVLLRTADALHDDTTVDDDLFADLLTHFRVDEVLEIVICCGWYRLLAGVIGVAGLVAEPWATPFPDAPGSGMLEPAPVRA